MPKSKKVCLLGASAVGKTSLVRRYVHTLFDEKYHTTIGVKIDQKDVSTEQGETRLMLWDIEGQDEFQSVRTSFLRGTHGALFVVDSTRRVTLDTARALRKQMEDNVGSVPHLLVLNKSDLEEQCDIKSDALTGLREDGWNLVETSAKTGTGVEDAFTWLAQRMMEE